MNPPKASDSTARTSADEPGAFASDAVQDVSTAGLERSSQPDDSQRTHVVVSVSLGSSRRDHEVHTTLLGHPFVIKRIGTDGDFRKAQRLLAEIDGTVDAIGLGGIDVYVYSKRQRFALRDGLRLMEVVKKTPVVDGSGLKNSLEREVVRWIARNEDTRIPLRDRKTLVVCGMDRFGMATALEEAGARVVYGDLVFSIGHDRLITSLEELADQADRLLPEVTRMPISFIYPVGKQQEAPPDTRYSHYYADADIIAGDFHFIRRYMPPRMDNKVILTNTVTSQDIEDLRDRGVAYLVTTTPEFNGRSFGTNVLEAALLALLRKSWTEVTADDYLTLIRKLDLKPRVVALGAQSSSPHHEPRSDPQDPRTQTSGGGSPKVPESFTDWVAAPPEPL